MSAEYSWRRYWILRGETYHTDQYGFLYEPTAQYAEYYSAKLYTAEHIQTAPCSILLGEPGAGKSHELEKLFKETKNNSDENTFVCWIDLKEYTTDDGVRKAFTQALESLDKTEKKNVVCFIDSLDEGQINVKTIITVLTNIFRKYIDKIERLSIRLACRSVEWITTELEDSLKQLWGEENVRVLELAPLTYVNVEEAVETNGCKMVSFINELVRINATAFARTPITLNMLIGILKKDGGMPKTAAELYYEGCKLLCREFRKSIEPLMLESEQRLVIASRIAALMAFSGRNSIYIGQETWLAGDHDILVGDFCNYHVKFPEIS